MLIVSFFSSFSTQTNGEKPLLFYIAEWNTDIKLVYTVYGKSPSRMNGMQTAVDSYYPFDVYFPTH